MIIFRQKYYSTSIGRFFAGVNKKVLKLPKSKAYRNAINSQNKVLTKVASGLNEARDIYYRPGHLINKGIESTIENPIASIGAVAGKVTDVVYPESIAIPKSTIAMVIGNKILPRKTKNSLKRASEKYSRTKFHNKIERIPSIPELSKLAEFAGKGLGM